MNVHVTMLFRDIGGYRHTRTLDFATPSIGDVIDNVEVYIESLCDRHGWEVEDIRFNANGKGAQNEEAAQAA